MLSAVSIAQISPECWRQHHSQKYYSRRKSLLVSTQKTAGKVLQYTQLWKKYEYLEICQWQCKAGDKMDKIVISMLSAIQHNPVHSDNLTWNHPKPNAFTACVTVNVSASLRHLETCRCWVCYLFTIWNNWHRCHFDFLGYNMICVDTGRWLSVAGNRWASGRVFDVFVTRTFQNHFCNIG